MKIELKNINVSLAHSEETTLFNAVVYINGIKAAYAKNDGIGGSTWYNACDKSTLELVTAAEKYCEGLPAMNYGSIDIPMNLEHFIDDLVEKYVAAKEDKRIANKLLKDMLKGICYGTKTGYTLITWKGHTIASIMQHPQGKATLKAKVLQLQSAGETILNTNLTGIL